MDYFVSREDFMQERPNTDESGMSDTDSTTDSTAKKNLLPWKIVCLVLVLLVSLGWVGIIALLIMKEEWQLVLVAWLLLYAAVHFCYWYCRRHSSRALSSQIRNQVVARIRGTDVAACEGDSPPSYDDLVKNEVPPPAYYTVVKESPKSKHRILNVQALPLPWFLKKKALENARNNNKTMSPAIAVVDVEGGAVASTSSAPGISGISQQTGESSNTHPDAWKSSGSSAAAGVSGATSITIDNDEDETLELPSYESLMREVVVMTPIHQALAGLPKVPSPGARRTLEVIAEAEQENQQQQSQ